MPKVAKLDSEQRKIVRLIRREGRNIRDPRVRRVYERAAVQTGLVESGLHNLKHGDADSQGWRQERASLYDDPTNLGASIKRFRQEFEQQYAPGEKSYQVAADVQRPRADLRGRYHDEAGKASGILGGFSPSLSSQGTPRKQARTTYTPGVDRSALRQQAKLSYLDQRGRPGALLDLKGDLDANQDTPVTRTTTQAPAPAAPPRRGKASPIRELFYNGPGGINIDEGKRVGKGFVSGHTDHAHLALDDHEALMRAAKLATRMGLSVREFAPYDKVDPVHAKGSFHYRKKAMDVSGKRVAEWARRVASGRY